MVNALPLYEGITRVRHTINRTEESILDFFIVCDKILPLVEKMKIDVDGVITLTRFRGKVVKTDHHMLQLEIDMNYHIGKKHDRNEAFNVRNNVCQQKFFQFTSK